MLKGCACSAAGCCRVWGWRVLFAVNWFIILSTLVAGLGFGGYASVTGLVRSINQYR